ncbi:MAG: type VI secretion system contractile sheath large subunit, partial [Acidobacteriota bacterium]|nr:type VI secretion system contractile sheath large subunit [Acidobacteriota bacterium]
NFDEVMAKLAPEIRLPIGRDGAMESLRFSELDDFLPDRLFEQAEMFGRFRDLRLRVEDPATFPAVAAELGLGGRSGKSESPAPASRPASPPSPESLAGGSLLDQMVEQTEERGGETRPSRAPDELQEFVRRVTEPHLVAASDPRQAEVLGIVDKAIGAQMRALLHVPDLQALEAAWRAVFFLIRRVETGSQLKIFLVDVSKEELAADLGASGSLRESGLYRLLVEKSVGTPGAEPWTLLVGNYTFGPGRADAELLGRLAKIAAAAGAPFVAAADSRLVGCASFGESPSPRDWRVQQAPEDAEAWAALRGLPQASYVGLLLPRFLLRLPYGKSTRSVETFAFEEMAPESAHEDYLWGNPAFAGLLLLAQAFSEEGWNMRPGAVSAIDGLPLHVYERDGERRLKPCAEALLTEDAAERILERGLMPLVSLKGQDVVRLVRFQSIAQPLRALAGRWSG